MKNLLFIVFCSITVLGCKKNPFDYRTKFLGAYSFTVHESSYDPSVGSLDTTYYYEGKITTGSDENSILIPSPHSTLQATVYEDGTIVGQMVTYGTGEFSSTKQMIYLWGIASPGLQDFYQLSGEKK